MSLAGLFRNDGRFDEANAHVERAKSYMANSPYYLGRAMKERAMILYMQHEFEEARSEALCAADIYERLGAVKEAEDCRELLQRIEKELDTPPVASRQSDLDCELL